MEDVKTVTQILGKDYYMAKIDLKSAYHSIPIANEDRKFLRFRWKGILYEYTCLPFGLCTAPRVFTKLLKPVVAYLRNKGYISVVFIDDLLLIGLNYDMCIANITSTLSLLESLGFTINYDKSVITPTRKLEYLGFQLDTIEMTIQLPKHKKEKILKLIPTILNRPTFTIHDCAKVIGTLVAASPAVPYSLLYCRQLERDKESFLSIHEGDFSKPMYLSKKAIEDCRWWLNRIPESKKYFKLRTPDIVIFTDASLSGWGASLNNETTRGFWSFLDRNRHINELELLAVELALRSFCSTMSDIHILLRIDNTTALAYVNRFGGCHSIRLHEIAKRIWMWCETRNIFLTASYIASSENFIADQESRAVTDDSEWVLDDAVFCQLCRRFFNPSIDLFASYVSNKCSKYISWHPDPFSCGVDAFTVSWGAKFYAFPPFCLIPKVIDKVIRENARGILVVPSWPSQPWYPLFKCISESSVLVFGPNINLLTCPFSRKPHPLHRTLMLEAAIISGTLLNKRD